MNKKILSINHILRKNQFSIKKSKMPGNTILFLFSFSQRPSLPTLEVTPVQIGELLSTSLNWDFQIFKLEEVTERRWVLFFYKESFLQLFLIHFVNDCDPCQFQVVYFSQCNCNLLENKTKDFNLIVFFSQINIISDRCYGWA